MPLQPKFEQLSNATGLDIVDPVETRHFSLLTNETVVPTRADPDAFAFPIDTACRITTDGLRLPYMIPVDVRTPDGDHLTSIDTSTNHELPIGDYLLELHSPIKVYLRVSGGGRIEATSESVTFEFTREVTVKVGARSYHSEPAATISVPDDPGAMIDAISTFPSALKTTSPERAWPTLRGHPPRIERGDELVIPNDLDVPETGIRVEVPPEYWAVYTVAPLTYYLAATVVPSNRVAVTAESGVAHDLGEDAAEVADAAESLLKRVFFLDCVTRTEGLYPDDLHERAVLETYVDFDFADLYDASPAERLAVYLSVSDEAIAAIESPWHRVTHVEPVADVVELLPYVVNDLSLVRARTGRDEPQTATEEEEQLNDEIDAFLRSPTAGDAATADGDFVRSAGDAVLRRDGDSESDANEGEASATNGVPTLDEYVSLPDVNALEQAWVGEGTPLHGTKLVREAFTHDTPEPSDGTIEITVVCNDPEMREELTSVGEIYGSRDDIRVAVTTEFGLETHQLRDRLADDADVFHFIGHIDGYGFQCPDGVLDASTVEETNATTVLLNGCRSHDQGIELVKAGASTAVVSLADLYNSGAVEVGENLARLFHHGFSIGSAMKIVREYTSIGNRYVVVGDPGVVIAQYERIFPILYHIIDQDEDGRELAIEPQSYAIRDCGIGTTFKPFKFESDCYHIISGMHGAKTLTQEEFRGIARTDHDPLVVDGTLVWSDSWFTRS